MGTGCFRSLEVAPYKITLTDYNGRKSKLTVEKPGGCHRDPVTQFDITSDKFKAK